MKQKVVILKLLPMKEPDEILPCSLIEPATIPDEILPFYYPFLQYYRSRRARRLGEYHETI
jgi:hypothetical protein